MSCMIAVVLSLIVSVYGSSLQWKSIATCWIFLKRKAAPETMTLLKRHCYHCYYYSPRDLPTAVRHSSPSLLLLLLFSCELMLLDGAAGEVPASAAAAAAATGYRPSRYESGRCERITVPLCVDMKYNMTRMPNLVGHSSQSEAAMQVGINTKFRLSLHR